MIVLKDAKLSMVELRIRFVRPDVAIVHQTHVLNGKRSPNGDELPAERQLSIRVLVKQKGKWLTTAFHSTTVRSVEPPAPAKSLGVSR